MVELTDTHCHIHEAEAGYRLSAEVQKQYEQAGSPSPEVLIESARAAGVTQLLCVGTSVTDSELAVNFVKSRPGTWATIGIHPHDARNYTTDNESLRRFADLATQSKVVAVGECGLDYFYAHSPKDAQEKILRFQIELALKHDLPMVFHVRKAFKAFWPIFDSYKGIRGVIHSFTSDKHDLDEILRRHLYVGLNGITTFMRAEAQLAAVKAVPLEKLLLETDAPFLTPTPYRGKMCEPKHVRVTAEFLADLREEPLDMLAARTNKNVQELFGLNI